MNDSSSTAKSRTGAVDDMGSLPHGAKASRPSRQSIYDLAQRAGVSASTVSRVLNQREGIGDGTRKLILEHARAAGFRPRMRARERTIAVVTDRSRFAERGGFVAGLLSCIVQVLSKEDVAVELVTEHNRDRLCERLVDGVLAMAWDDETLLRLRQLKGVPVVTLNAVYLPEFSAVASNHRRQAELAVEYFVRFGHRRIVMICEEASNWGSTERVAGFTDAMRAAGLPVDDTSTAFTNHQPLYRLLHRLMTTVRPTALFVATENIVLEAAYVIERVLGLRVPADVSIIGMESPNVSQFLSTPMTTISQPLDALATRALELLLNHIDRDNEPQAVILDNRLIERESVAVLKD